MVNNLSQPIQSKEMENFKNAGGVQYVPEIPRDRNGNVIVKKEDGKERFSFLEVLIVLSAVAVVGLLVLLAINPSKESATARNLQRSADVSTVLSYVTSYVGRVHDVPHEIPTTVSCVEYMNEICKTGPYDCTDLVDMSFLAGRGSDELVIMPNDPRHISINGTGYYISQDGKGLVTVCAPYAERNEEISFSKFMQIN